VVKAHIFKRGEVRCSGFES